MPLLPTREPALAGGSALLLDAQKLAVALVYGDDHSRTPFFAPGSVAKDVPVIRWWKHPLHAQQGETIEEVSLDQGSRQPVEFAVQVCRIATQLRQ